MTEGLTGSPATGSLAGARFAFQSDAADLTEYARAHLAPLAPARRDASPPSVNAVLRWHDGQPPAERPVDASELARMERVDRDLYTDGERLCWFRVDDLRDLYLQITWKDERLTVLGDFYYRLGNTRMSDTIRRARQWRRHGTLRARRFTTLLAYLVYYPCWWWLEHMRDLHPIHAAGALTDAGVVLLAGASGAGKSTLAVALAMTPGARLLSDSFVLHHGLDVQPVREPILLDAWSRSWLGQRGDELVSLKRRYGLHRVGYQVPAERLADGGRAALLLFPRRARETYVRRLLADQAHHRLSAADLIINDLRRYWAFAAVMEQVAPAGLMARREAHLAQLAAEVPCYDLGVTATATRAAVTESILRLTQDQQLRVASGRP